MRTIISNSSVFVFAVLSLIAACSHGSEPTGSHGLDRYPLDAESLQQWRLPTKLTEISGLALTPDDRLFAITDEGAIVYELDYRKGRIVKAFALGNPTVRGDFEGLAVLNDIFYLVTSDGRLYATAEGNNGARMRFKIYETGLGKLCEIEGLAQDIQSNTLLLACKESRVRGGELFIFVWSPSSGNLVRERDIVIPVDEITDKLAQKRISPSAIVVDPATAHLFLIAARQRAIFEMKPDGVLVNAIMLPLANRHRQAEGIEITRNDQLLIADEGGYKKARLSIYASSHKKATDQQK